MANLIWREPIYLSRSFEFNLRSTGFPCGSAGKESACSVGDLDLILELGRSPGEGKGYPLQYSGLQNAMDCIVHRVADSDMTEQLSSSRSMRKSV